MGYLLGHAYRKPVSSTGATKDFGAKVAPSQCLHVCHQSSPRLCAPQPASSKSYTDPKTRPGTQLLIPGECIHYAACALLAEPTHISVHDQCPDSPLRSANIISIIQNLQPTCLLQLALDLPLSLLHAFPCICLHSWLVSASASKHRDLHPYSSQRLGAMRLCPVWLLINGPLQLSLIHAFARICTYTQHITSQQYS